MLFAVDSQTGQLRLARGLDFEASASHNVTVRVFDDGLGALHDEQTLTVHVLDVNDAPFFTSTISSISTPEDTPVSTVLQCVEAEDVDDSIDELEVSMDYSLPGVPAAEVQAALFAPSCQALDSVVCQCQHDCTLKP